MFAVTILVPGLVLGVLGLRALLQDRQLAEQQVREQLAVIAESTGRQLELDLRDWQQAVEQIALMGPTDFARWPERVRLAMTEPGGAVLLAGSQARPDVLPAGQLLYAMSPVPRTSPAERPSSLVTRAAEGRGLRRLGSKIPAGRQPPTLFDVLRGVGLFAQAGVPFPSKAEEERRTASKAGGGWRPNNVRRRNRACGEGLLVYKRPDPVGKMGLPIEDHAEDKHAPCRQRPASDS